MEILTKQDLIDFKKDFITEFKTIINSKPALPAVLKSGQVRGILGCSDSKLTQIRNAGLLPFTQVMGTYYYKLDDVNKLIGGN